MVIPVLAAPMLPAVAADRLDITAGAIADPATLDPTIITGRRLDAARAAIEPRLGASTYTLPSQAIENRQGANNTPFNQIMLQTPGVSQEAFGQIHVGNEMANMQYRLNGIILPQGVTSDRSHRLARNTTVFIPGGARPQACDFSLPYFENLFPHLLASGFTPGSDRNRSGPFPLVGSSLPFELISNPLSVAVERKYKLQTAGTAGHDAFFDPPAMCLELCEIPVELRPRSAVHQDAFARFRKTISWARSTKARRLAAMWRRPG
jgi:hypothetical protein